jgi:hypothetical protein
MPRYHLIATLLILTTASLAYAGPEGGDHKHKKKANAAAKAEKQPEWAGLFGGASLPVVWQSASAAATHIAAAINAKKFEGVAEWAETVHLAAHALEDQVKLSDAEQQKRLKGALEQAAKIADDVIGAANQKEAEKLADSFRRMNAALKLAATRLPKEIVNAPKQEVRFAKTAGLAHDGKGGHAESKK